MTAVDIVSTIQARGGCMMLVENRLRVEPIEAVDESLAREILARKAELRDYIARGGHSAYYARVMTMLRRVAKSPDRWLALEFEIEERAAILEADAGLSREIADEQAEQMTIAQWLLIDETSKPAA